MYRVDVDPPKHARSACQANRAGPPSGAVRTAAARMMGGPSISEVDVDISSAPTAKSKLSTGITSRPRSARARVPRRDTPQSPLQLFNTEDELFDTDGATSDDDLDEDTLAQITDELAQRTAAIRAKVQATHARRVGGVDAALAKLQLAVDADAYARHRAAVIETDGTIQADPRSLDPAHRAKSQQATRSRRRLCNRVGVDTAAVSRGFKSAVDKTVEEAVTKLGPSRFAATTDLSAKETKKAIAAAKAASKGPVGKKQSGSKAQTAVKSESPMKDDPEAELDGELRFNAQSVKTQPLRDWLLKHFDKPYPEDADKLVLAERSGMTRAQVGNWFINARVRIWRPMVLRLGEEIEREATP